MELFSFKQGIQIIVSPNSKNVKLVVKKVTSDIEIFPGWLRRLALKGLNVQEV